MKKTTQNRRFDRKDLHFAYQACYPACETILQELSQKVRRLLEEAGQAPTIKQRVKSFDAYYQKLRRNQARSGSSFITDLLGLRIICPFLEDLDEIERLLTGRFAVIETVRKGANHSFREFGYDSVHLVIRLEPAVLKTLPPEAARTCEIQLRTILQDAWAEVEHELIYKSDISLPNDTIRRKLASLNATLTLSDLIFQEIRDFQRNVREKGRRRRETMESRLFGFPSITIAPPGPEKPWSSPPEEEPLPPVRGNAIETAMFDALQAHSSGDLDRAISLYTRILHMKLTDALRSLVYNHRGMAYFAHAEYRKALRDFSRALSRDPENTRSYNNRGLTRRVMKQFDRALEDYNRSLAVDPDQPEALWGRAQTFYDMQLATRAIADCRELLALQPEHRPAADLLTCLQRGIF